MLKNIIKYWQKCSARKSKVHPKSQPTEAELKRWASSEWIEYQAWLFHHSFLTLHDWQQLRDKALSWRHRPFLSIVTPVFNTHPDHLRECIYSVQTQAYPDWEMCLVDDGSDNPATVECLQTLVLEDSRLRLRHFPRNQGICQATNQALAMACGDYIVFLDHDDRLAPDALYHVAETLRNHPDTEIIYSDRDSLSERGFRFMHLFKPDWSPETLLSGNYLFHLVVYQRKRLEQLGGVRIGLEGSQDYDLILRASAEKEPKVQHISKVLYHWRQHKQSVAMEQNVKEYVYTTGVQALQDTLKQRGLQAHVSENKELWRGHYRVRLNPSPGTYQVLHLSTLQDYAVQVNNHFERETNYDYLVILGPNVQIIDKDALTELTSWLQIAAVGMVTGKVLDNQGHLLHAGLVQRPNGIPLALYAGFPENAPCYMAVTAIMRNVSSPHPACYVLERALWQRLEGLNVDYIGPYALLDFSLRALTSGTRIVYTPYARFLATEWQTPEMWSEIDHQRFTEQWMVWLKQGDPYYNSHLTLELADMGLNLSIKERL